MVGRHGQRLLLHGARTLRDADLFSVALGSLTETLAHDNRFLSITISGKIGWQMQNLNPLGACGDATRASVEKGRAVLEFVAERFVELLYGVDRFDLGRFGHELAWR